MIKYWEAYSTGLESNEHIAISIAEHKYTISALKWYNWHTESIPYVNIIWEQLWYSRTAAYTIIILS